MQLPWPADAVVPLGIGAFVAVVAVVALVLGLRRRGDDPPTPTHADWTGENVEASAAPAVSRRAGVRRTVADAIAARRADTDPFPVVAPLVRNRGGAVAQPVSAPTPPGGATLAAGPTRSAAPSPTGEPWRATTAPHPATRPSPVVGPTPFGRPSRAAEPAPPTPEAASTPEAVPAAGVEPAPEAAPTPESEPLAPTAHAPAHSAPAPDVAGNAPHPHAPAHSAPAPDVAGNAPHPHAPAHSAPAPDGAGTTPHPHAAHADHTAPADGAAGDASDPAAANGAIPHQAPIAAGSSRTVAAAVAHVLAARAASPAPGADRRGDARDRLLAVLLDDPLRAVGAAVDLQDCQERIDRLAGALNDERGRLRDVLGRLARSGLRADQLARLSGLSDSDVTELLHRRQDTA